MKIETQVSIDKRFDAMVAALLALVDDRGHAIVTENAAQLSVWQALQAQSAFGAWTALLGASPKLDPVWVRNLLREHDCFPLATESVAAFLKRAGLPNPADRRGASALDRFLGRTTPPGHAHKESRS